jgi:hypothetical protein
MSCQYTFLAPSGTPQNLHIISIDDTTIAIEWEPVECRHWNGEITGYKVTYYHGAEMMTQMLPESDHAFTATGLLFSKMYTFEVVALSWQYGAGPPATVMETTSALQGNYTVAIIKTILYTWLVAINFVLNARYCACIWWSVLSKSQSCESQHD